MHLRLLRKILPIEILETKANGSHNYHYMMYSKITVQSKLDTDLFYRHVTVMRDSSIERQAPCSHSLAAI
jgi:hypothetical protein